MVLPLRDARYHDIVGLGIEKDRVNGIVVILCRAQQSLETLFDFLPLQHRRHCLSSERISAVGTGREYYLG
jgi:hypothetical protein